MDPCVLQLAHIGFSALHLICLTQCGFRTPTKLTNLSPATKGAGLDGPLADSTSCGHVAVSHGDPKFA